MYSTLIRRGYLLRRNHDARVFVPAQERVLPVLRLRLLDIRPAKHKVPVRVRLCEAPGYAVVQGLYDVKIGGEENVKVPLVDLAMQS